jgi:hypothetical protein
MASLARMLRVARTVVLIALLVVSSVSVASRAARDIRNTVTIYADRLADRDLTNWPTEDYVVFYAAGRMVRDGRGSGLYDIDAIVAEQVAVKGRPVGGTGRLGYFNPPFVALAWVPLTFLALDAALVTWAVAVGLAMAAVAVWGPGFLGLRGWRWALASAAMLLSHGTIVIFIQAQLTPLVILGWVLFAGFLGRGRHGSAGASLALALVKPHFVVLPLAALAWRRDWAALRGFAAVATPLVAISLAVSGPSALWEYPSFLRESAGWVGMNGVYPPGMPGWHGYFHRAAADPGWYTTAAFALTLVTAALAFRYARWREVGLAALLAASLLVSLHIYAHDMALLVVCAWFLVVHRPQWWPLLVVVPAVLAGSLDLQTLVMAALVGSLAVYALRTQASGTTLSLARRRSEAGGRTAPLD